MTSCVAVVILCINPNFFYHSKAVSISHYVHLHLKCPLFIVILTICPCLCIYVIPYLQGMQKEGGTGEMYQGPGRQVYSEPGQSKSSNTIYDIKVYITFS